MNLFPRLSLALVTCLAALGTALAAADGASPADAPVPASTLTRAEVLADLEVWQQSGMAALHAGDGMPDVFSPRFAEAARQYVELRQAPAFAMRVQEIALRRGGGLALAAR